MAETETRKPRIRGPYGRAYWLDLGGKTYGPFSNWANAHKAAVQLLAKESRRA